MSKSATEQFQIKKKRKHPLSINATTPLLINKSSKRYVHSQVLPTSDLLIKENYSEFQIDDKASKFNITNNNNNHSLLQINKSINVNIKTNGATAAAAGAVAAAAALNNLTDSKSKTAAAATTTTTTSAHTPITDSSVAAALAAAIGAIRTQNCLRDQSQVLCHDNIMPLSHGFYVKGALASKRGLKSMKSNTASGSSASSVTLSSHEEAKRPRKSNENLKLRTSTLLAGPTANNLQLSYLFGESLARHGRLQEAFDMYALIASEQPEGFIPLEKLNILATALLEHIRILSSNSKKSSEQMAADSKDPLNINLGTKATNCEQNKLITPLRNKYAAATASNNNNNNNQKWPLPSLHSSKLKDMGSEFLSSAVGGNLDLHAPSRELANASYTQALEDYDPLLCPLCRDVLRCPVTTNCGHTFCRQCCETITMCNICHVKFPRLHKDDYNSINDASNLNINFNTQIQSHNKALDLSTSLATLSTATTTTTVNSLDLNIHHQPIYPTATSSSTFTTSLGATTSSTTSSSSSYSTSTQLNELPRLQIIATAIASPTTVTTTTIACTTDTATTTMASTASTSGGALRSSSSLDNMKFMPDVLVRRLVEKWWGADLQAKKINETATSYMHLNLLDDALKYCNASLEKSPTNFKSLLLRAEVLRKMNHYQSSLADVDNALKTRYTSAKAHYLRALALSDLSRYEEALYEICLAVGMDKSSNLSNTELFQHDLTKILQKLLSQTPKCLKVDLQSVRNKAPYTIYPEQRLRRKNLSLHSNTVQDEEFINLYEDDDFLSASYAKECDIMADDDALDFLNCTDKRTVYASFAKKYELERQNTRKHFRRKWLQKETELLPSIDVESARCSSQFRNVLERMQQEIVRLKKIESSPEYLQRQLVDVNVSLIDASDFDCVLCCRTFWKPVVTPCGHTYCMVCLDRCMDYTSSCPLCMSPLVEPSMNVYQGASSPVPLMLTKRPVTKFLEAAMKRFIPDSYHKRFRQEMVMEPSVPIFICTTAFPYVPCPLIVYEPRYRLMVRRAVESGDKQFGIVLPHSGKSRYYDYGCILDIRDCVLLGDGSSILSTIGCKRFKILARNEKDGYETAKVEYIHDETIPDEHFSYVSKMHDVVLSKAIQWYQSLGEDLKHEILQSYGEMPRVEENWETIADGPAWAWWIIALLPLRPQLKVDILATTSLEKRLRAIEKTINSMPGNYHYQSVSQNCDVAVVAHNQQHHTLHNVDGDVDDDEVDDVDDNLDEEDVDDEDQRNVIHHMVMENDDNDDDDDDLTHDSVNVMENLTQHHIQNINHDQQHSAQTALEQQQQCDNVETVDECCQRTTTTTTTAAALVHNQLEVADETMEIIESDHGHLQQQQHHHHHHNHHHHHHRGHHRTGHNHSLLL